MLKNEQENKQSIGKIQSKWRASKVREESGKNSKRFIRSNIGEACGERKFLPEIQLILDKEQRLIDN